ncbi:MAG: hypothetical protein FDX18_06320 [Chlorobium sp.]|nr:MAG: hypothetical protein FDX18_06320 [Chlorobium sp.]
MGLFERFFAKESNEREKVRPEMEKPDIKRLFEEISVWSIGKRFIDIDPKYSEVIRNMPAGEGSSMRLSRVPGTISVSGEQPKVLGYPGSLEFNMPALASLSGTARVLVDLGYSGVEREAAAIRDGIMNRRFKLRITSLAEQSYPLVRLQVGFFNGLQEPLFLEVLSDILDRNVQDFYSSLVQSGRYEISLHVQRNYLASVFHTISDRELNDIANGLAAMVAHLKKITPSGWNMAAAVRLFERRHPLGEGMLP